WKHSLLVLSYWKKIGTILTHVVLTILLSLRLFILSFHFSQNGSDYVINR
ncbi:hypothetical protein BYT27DRAFT_7343023, partial [Phlegmacium glaucopus]